MGPGNNKLHGRGIFISLFLLANLLLTPVMPLAEPSDDNEPDDAPEPAPHSRQASTAAPDLKVMNISLAVENPMDGSMVGVFAQVDNIGFAAAKDFSISIYSSGTEISSVQVASLAAGNTTTASARVEVRSGYLELKAVADILGDVAELSEANNMLVRTIKVPSPDLMVTELSFLPANYTDGDKVIITATIKNGAADTIIPFSCSISVDEEPIQSKTFSGIRSGDSVVMMGQWTVSSGQHDLIARADAQHALHESNSSNNVMIKPLSANYPDLRIEGIKTQPALTNVSDGDSVLITAKVRNAGKSTHNMFHARLLVDGIETGTMVVTGLEMNGTRDLAFQWVALGGKHELRMDLDPDRAVSESNEGNNYALLGADMPMPDMTVDELRLTPIMPVDGGEVKASAIVKNNGPGRTNRTILVEFLANGEIVGDIEIPKGLKFNSTAYANISFEVHAGKTLVAAIVDRAKDIPESDEGNNGASKVLDVMFPDLYVTNLTVSPNATSLIDGGAGTVTVTVRNGGPGNTTTSFMVDIFLDGKMLSRVPVNGLPSGVPKVIFTEFIATGGAHYLSARVDTTKAVRESNETNNIVQMSLLVGLPDILIVDLFWAPSSPALGQIVTLTAVLRNLGKPTDRDIWVEFLANGTPVTHTSVPGATLVGAVDVQTDYRYIGGENTMEVVVDKQKEVPEINRSDNKLMRTFPAGNLVQRTPGPDLVVSDLSWLPAKPVDGEEISFIVSITNKGSVPDPGPDGSKALQPGVTILIDNEKVSANSVKLLSTDGVVVVPWMCVPGIHTVKAIIDWEMAIAENNETNNVASKDMTIGRADLKVSDIEIVAKGSEDGNTVSVFVKANNLGNRTMRTFQLTYFVDGLQVGAEDVEGATLNKTTTVLHSWTATPGQHDIIVMSDMFNQVVEYNEMNNILNGSFSVKTPDLVLGAFKVPAIVDDGSSAVMTAQVMNKGLGGTIRPFLLKFYLDGQEVGSETINGLPSGGEIVVSRTVVPGPGNHYIRAVVDPSGLVTESSELNNANSRPGLNVTYSDLAVVKVWMEPQLDITTLIMTTVANKGNSTTRPVDIRFFLDGDLVATETLDGLAGKRNTTIMKAMSLGPGSHRIRAVIDPDGELSESDESNNQGVLTTPFQPYPNLYIDELELTGPMVQGGQLHVTAKVKALNGDVRSSFIVALFVDGAQSSSTRIGGIPRGEISVVSFTTFSTVGQHHIRLQVDSERSVPETNEADNAQVSSFTVDASDLQVTEVQSFTHTNGLAVFARVRNNASSLLTPFIVSFYADGKAAGKVQVKGLPSMTSTQVMVVVPSTTGNVLIKADEAALVPEIDESNNERSARLRPNPVDGELDLEVADIFWVPQYPADGDTATFFVLIDNVGNRTLLGDATVEVKADNNTVAQGEVVGLPEGGTAVLTFQWEVWAGMNINITARVDPEISLGEVQTVNNVLTTWMNVTLPDLKVLSVTYPNGSFGQSGTIYVKVGNIGEGDTYKRFSTGVIVEGKQVAMQSMSALPAGANTTVALVVERSWGAKEFLVEVDPERAVKESNEGNTRLSNLTLGYPDLQLIDVWTESGANASSTTGFAQVKNAGTGIGRSFTVNMFINGVGLGSKILNGLSLNGTAVLSWAFPTRELMTIAASADEGNLIPESNELNNHFERNMTGNMSYIPPEVNLASSSLNIIQYGVPNKIFRLDALVENLGPNVTAFKVLFLVDGRILQEVLTEPMNNNTTRTISIFWSGSTSTHIFKVIADSEHAIPELDETDNELRLVHMANIAPTPLPGNDQTITQGDKATLYARGSDPDGRIVRYEWDFDGDGTFEWSSNESKTIRHTYNKLPAKGARTFNATLKVTDDKGAISTAVVHIKVVEKRPWFNPPEADMRQVVAYVLGLACITAGLIILYLFMRAGTPPMKVTKAEKERQARLEKDGYKRPWPPWRSEPKQDDDDERDLEPKVDDEQPVLEGATKVTKYPDYPEDDGSTAKAGADDESPDATITEPELGPDEVPAEQYPDDPGPEPSDETKD